MNDEYSIDTITPVVKVRESVKNKDFKKTNNLKGLNKLKPKP